MTIGTLQVDVHVPNAQSLKDKRSVIKSLKDQLHNRFHIAVAELEPNEKWQRALLGIAAVGESRGQVERSLRQVVEALRANPLIALIHIEEEYW